MSKWQQHSESEQYEILQIVAERRNLLPVAVEKDWWVVTCLKALSTLSCAPHLLFKGGTSLSKGWNLIDRFSEDIDLALKREDEFSIKSDTKSQRDRLRKAVRKYVTGDFCAELEAALLTLGVRDFSIIPITTRQDKEGNLVDIDSDKDPTVVWVEYKSVCPETIDYIPPRVKMEISCLSMHEPVQSIPISSYISQEMKDIDSDTTVTFPTVLPSRTLLEKAFLLNEEFSKNNPRTLRMSRHLYDMEKLMDTDFGKSALSDTTLYNNIVGHRKLFYALKYFDYARHNPDSIVIVPPDHLLSDYESDYVQMCRSFIYGTPLPFDKLLSRIQELQQRFRNLPRYACLDTI